MKNQRVPRALKLALISSCFGLLCCISVFFLCRGASMLTLLLPVAVFLTALLLALPVCAAWQKSANRKTNNAKPRTDEGRIS